tara:strand:+ start:1442 stop:1951 length:510 start_codon:yes stop_codon:yes gene_type:complete
MKCVYVNYDTGELSEEPKEGFDLFEGHEEERRDEDWLPNWYLKKRVQIDAQLGALKMQYERRVSSLQAELRGLEFVYGDRVKLAVNSHLVGAKKKSVHFEFGTMGYRKSNRTEVTDKKLALDWARANCDKAVKMEIKETLLKSELPKNVDIPGVERVSKENFYVSIPKS